MRSTRPHVVADDPAALEQIWTALEPDPSTPRPAIRAVMISSIDGTTTADGRSGGLGTPTDHLLFHAMRARADLILVGSTTALTEGYGPAVVTEAWRDRRDAPPPPVLLLSRSLSDAVIDHCAGAGPGMGIVAAHDADPDRIRAARARGVPVHVLDPGPFGESLRALTRQLGATEVDLEGGPEILGAALSTGGLDELVLTLSPQVMIGGDATRLVTHPGGPATRVPMRVVDSFSASDGGLYTRWVVDGQAR